MRLDVVAVGEMNPDLILEGLPAPARLGQEMLASRCTFALGGSTALCAANLAALGLSVGIAGKVGADPFGEFVLRSLAERGVDVSRVVRSGASRTGVTVSLAYPADRAMVTFPGAMESFSAPELDPDYVGSARHLHVSSLFLQRGLQPGLPDLFRSARGRGLTVSLDPGWDPAEEWGAGVETLYGRLDVLFVNRVEVRALGRDQDWRRAAARLAQRVPLLVVKGGEEGAAVAQGDDWQEQPGFPVEAVDPTGAGDAFDAGFLCGLLDGRPLTECAVWGNACGALTAARPGGSGAFGCRAEVEAFIRSKTR